MLLAGKPILQLPIFLEQTLNSMAVTRLGAGLTASPVNPGKLAEWLTALLHSERYAEAANRFAARYARPLPDRQVCRMARRSEELLERAGSAAMTL